MVAQVRQVRVGPAWAVLAKGRPQVRHRGSVMKLRAVKQVGQKVPCTSTCMVQVGQWGGSRSSSRIWARVRRVGRGMGA